LSLAEPTWNRMASFAIRDRIIPPWEFASQTE
jgi:hypothetical protein